MAKTDWENRDPNEDVTDDNTVDADALNALGVEVNAKVDKHTGADRFIVAESLIGTPISMLNQDFPADAIGFILTVIMPGGGGASGRRGAAGSVRNGGGAGGGGGMTIGLFVSKPVGAVKWHLNIPSPGLGGAAVTADNTNGNPGVAPAGGQNGGSYGRFWITDIADVVLWEHYWYPGGIAPGGTNTTMAVTGGGFGVGFVGGAAPAPSATGGVGGGSANSAAPCGGGAGGGITSGDVPNNGGAGGWNPSSNTTLPTAGTTAGAIPNAGAGVTKMPGLPGNGGSGGAGSITGAAQAGADAVGYGAGGGGGGASLNGNNSGKGGNGGPGYVSIEWIYA